VTRSLSRRLEEKENQRLKNEIAGSIALKDAERHKCFVEMAHEVEASDDPNDFEEAFKKVAHPKKKPSS
jgi:hypothetical protein